MRISDWSSDVCSSDLGQHVVGHLRRVPRQRIAEAGAAGHLHHDAVAGRNGMAAHAGEPLAGRMIESPGPAVLAPGTARSEECRGGDECVSTCSARGWTNIFKTKQTI